MAGAFSLTGAIEVTQALKAMAVRANVATPIALKAAAGTVERRAKANLERKSHTRGTRTPSAPGEPPAMIDGTLRDSFKTTMPHTIGAGMWMCTLYPDTVYAAIQEFGGLTGRGHHSRLPARPYLKPALDAAIASGEFAAAFEKAWMRAVVP